MLSFISEAPRTFISGAIELILDSRNGPHQPQRHSDFYCDRMTDATSAAECFILHFQTDVAKHAHRGDRKFKVVRLASKLVGGRSGSQVACMPNLVQIGRQTKIFLGLSCFPGRAGSAQRAGGEPRVVSGLTGPFPGRPGSEKFKVVRFASKLVGGRPGSQVACMPNLVPIGRQTKIFLGLSCFPGRAGSGQRAGGEPRMAHAASPPPCPGLPASENFKVHGSEPNSVCREVGTGRARRRSIGVARRAGAEARPVVRRGPGSRQS